MRRILLTALMAGFSILSQAQDFLPFANSNYIGVNGIDLQPASIVDSRFRTDITFMGFNVNAYNNYVGLKPSALTKNNAGEYAAFNDSLFQDKYLIERFSGPTKSLYFNNQISLPSFLINIDKKSAMAFNWRVRNYVNVDGVTPELARLIYNELNYPDLFKRLQNQRLSIQYMSWAEYGITYGRVFKDDNEHFFKGAARVKVLQGLGAAYMYIDNLDYKFTNDSLLSVYATKVNYGHSTNFEFDNDNLKYKYISNFSVGLDLGFVYEWRPNYKDYKYDMDNETNLWMRYKNKYKAKVGLSVIDLGGIKFKKGQYSNDFNANTDLWNINLLEFGNTPVSAFDDTLRNRFTMQGGKNTFFMNLPTAISLQADYNIWKDVYVNFTTYWAFQFKKNENKVHDISTFSLTPRWDHKWFGVFVPVSYNMMGNFQVGTGLRLGPMMIGTSNLAPLTAALTQKGRDIYGADVCLIFKIPIEQRQPKDRDKDKISDKKDKCKDEPGVWEFMGCADKDGDHIQDKDDQCPEIPGIAEFKGCPDKDGDHIMDLQDDCPEEPGLAEFKGCPDKDGDKIMDKEDECPDVPGLAEFKGCPDRDGDKVQDSKDECPDTPGPVEMAGCPDTDGDGLPDKQDKCPTKPGPIKNLGCPEIKLQLLTPSLSVLEESTLEDGKFYFNTCVEKAKALFKIYGEGSDTVRKVLVSCPELRGKHAFLEKDGMFHFPKEVEQVVLTPQEQEIVKKAFDNLEFATGKDIIKTESFASLDELAGLLQKHTSWKLKIEGHTDNVGQPQKNMLLSQKRSEAVKKYLVSKGVDAKRFEVKWYGQTKPIAPNTTEEGRQKNRRVEMTIVE